MSNAPFPAGAVTLYSWRFALGIVEVDLFVVSQWQQWHIPSPSSTPASSNQVLLNKGLGIGRELEASGATSKRWRLDTRAIGAYPFVNCLLVFSQQNTIHSGNLTDACHNLEADLIIFCFFKVSEHYYPRDFYSIVMTIVFERPLGAHRDIKELEYISALHQSGSKLRKNGSITAEDVIHYLKSRHGVKVDIEYVRNNLMPGLAGALGDDHDGIVFDLCEVLAILILPHLKEEAERGNLDFFEKVKDYMMLDVFGKCNGDVQLNRDLMVKVLETYGEYGIPPQVVDALLAQAGVVDVEGEGEMSAGTGKVQTFSAEVLMNACTSDLKQYSLEWTQSATTHYQDAFQGTTMDISENTAGDVVGSLPVPGQSPDIENTRASVRSKFDGTKAVAHSHTFPSIDYIAENFASKAFVTLLWVLVVVAYFTYVLQVTALVGDLECDRFKSEFACRISNAIAAWLVIFAQLSVLGFGFVFLCSFGNSVYLKRNIGSFLSIFVGIATVSITTQFPWHFEFEFFIFNTKRPSPDKEFQGIAVMILGIFLLLFQIKALALLLFPENVFQKVKSKVSIMESLLVPGMAKAEQATKEAAAFKTRLMVEDAVAMHEGTLPGSSLVQSTDLPSNSKSIRSAGDGRHGMAMLNFHATADDREQVGGVWYTWKRIFNGKLYSEDGVWIHARLYASNFVHLFICLLYVVIFSLVVGLFEDIYESTEPPTTSPAPTVNPDQGLANLAIEFVLPTLEYYISDINTNPNATSLFWSVVDSDLTRELVSGILGSLNETQLEDVAIGLSPSLVEFLYNSTSEAGSSDDTSRLLQELVDGAHLYEPVPSYRRSLEEDDLTPERWVTTLSGTLGFLGAFVATFALLIIWLPSAASTVLQFRCAVIGSLRDKEFTKYRVAPDLTTILFGSTFWGALFGSATMFVIVGGVTFIACWHVTRPVTINLVAQLVGIAVTTGVKVAIMMLLRNFIYAGFFRRNPSGANVMIVVMECWNLALTVLTLVMRLVKLLLISAFYVGRLDTPMLAAGVGNIGPVPLDSYPVQFRKDLLVHDAHRHPYMERLGVMYMLKLCHGDEFATKDGSAWRLLFVMALFPWMRRYRIDDEHEDIADSDDDGNQSKSSIRGKKFGLFAPTMIVNNEDNTEPADESEAESTKRESCVQISRLKRNKGHSSVDASNKNDEVDLLVTGAFQSHTTGGRDVHFEA